MYNIMCWHSFTCTVHGQPECELVACVFHCAVRDRVIHEHDLYMYVQFVDLYAIKGAMIKFVDLYAIKGAMIKFVDLYAIKGAMIKFVDLYAIKGAMIKFVRQRVSNCLALPLSDIRLVRINDTSSIAFCDEEQIGSKIFS